MTREDIFWILTRAAALWLFIEAVGEVPWLVTWIRLDTRFSEEATDPISGILARLFAAYALFEFDKRATRRRPASDGDARGEAKLSMRREDVLWVGLKLGAVYFMVIAFVGFLEIALPTMYGHFDLEFVLVAGLSYLGMFVAGLWVLLSDRLWRLAVGRPRADAPGEIAP